MEKSREKEKETPAESEQKTLECTCGRTAFEHSCLLPPETLEHCGVLFLSTGRDPGSGPTSPVTRKNQPHACPSPALEPDLRQLQIVTSASQSGMEDLKSTCISPGGKNV